MLHAACTLQDFSSLDDQQRFDGFLEKVSLSALDPTDDELINDIIAGAFAVLIWKRCEVRGF